MKINPIVIDISRYQVVKSFDDLRKGGIAAVINKATEGTTYVDPYFASRRTKVQACGMLYGAYHFLRPGSIEAQVDHFLSVVGTTDDLMLALDHEDPKVLLSEAKLFLQLLENRTGNIPVLYSGFLIKQQLGNRIDPELARVRLWLAEYGSSPTWPPTWARPWLWQFTGDGKGPPPHQVPGINQYGIDIDSYDGTPEQLAREWTGKEPMVPPPIPTPIPKPTAPWYTALWLWLVQLIKGLFK